MESCITGKEIKRYRLEKKNRTTRFYIFRRMVKVHYKLKQICDFLLNTLFLAAPILLIYEQIFQFSTLSFLHLMAPVPKIEQNYYEILLSETIFWICSTSVFFLLPFICILIANSSEKRLDNEVYSDIFGVLFDNLKHG